MTGDARYAAALERLSSLARFGVRPGLEPIARVLEALGHPERAVPALHVAGTNGKGSTAAFSDAILRAAGARVGLYTSPHLARFTERIRAGGPSGSAEIARDRCASLVERVMAAAGGDALTFFEVATAAAFLFFAEERVDLSVIEVGLGGRFDATACCAPFATVITGIALDHTALLGTTTAAIAGEKAGIARAGVPLVVGAVDEAASESITAHAVAVGAPLVRLGSELSVATDGERIDYRGPGGALDGALLGLAGEHQARNAALALAATSFAPGFRPDERARREGVAHARWPGRLEWIAPDLLLDAAHNPDGAAALARALDRLAPLRFTLLCGALADKDVDGVLAALLPKVARAVCTRPDSPRALAAEALAARVRALAPSLPVVAIDALHDALAEARRTGPVIGCGSIFLVGALRALSTGEPIDPRTVGDPLPIGTPH